MTSFLQGSGRPDQPPSAPAPQQVTAQAVSALPRLLVSAERQILARRSDPLSVSTSYVIMRNGIGALGLALPIVLIVGGGLDHVQPSLSAYYHFSEARPGDYGAGTLRDAFVGMLCAIGAFLFFYRGHSLQEDFALNVAGIAAILVALFPMDWPAGALPAMTRTTKLHSLSATAFFVMVAYVCVFRGRDTLCIMGNAGRRRRFERLYLVIGIAMLATPASIAALQLWPATRSGHSIILVEVAGVFVFAAYWLIKGFEIRSSLHAACRIDLG
ncbi:hypothetical protein [Sphingosinicella terrae]|uniref:hypothetical protein n=1 Tax=Sphingosinicella terrae TaxID=2172047 RepID=UPI0013B3BE4A|nr:hypothetical protein [Sphingosinicella terrae]